jgi:pimeloyl-ACP methyl ester carboxylesterase
MMRLLILLLLPLAAACATTDEAPAAFASERISVEVRGSGPDVVLIPGLSSSPDVWASTVAAVPGYRYHLVHVAGFAGKTGGANASGPVVAPVAEEIARYVAEAGLERPAIVGHSLGGAWAMMVAARHPELTSKIMVVDMLPFMGAMFGPPGATPESVEPIAEQIRAGIATRAGEQRRQIIEQTIATMIRTEGLRPATVEHSLASDPAVSGQAMYDLITTDLRPELARIKVPVTVLWVVPPNAPVGPAQMEGFYKLSYANTPQAVLKRISDSYHFIMFDQPEAFQGELRAFLAE